ncbi:hypothetical protein K474DRAFT_345480 [Panus rudis PR-1116 ss-1]|nr:hypothetical protein K474DRAFT_345480 [Panus rudis PR-1116 ss-1]
MSECYGNTRRWTLQAIEDWFNRFDKYSPRIFWICGPPGIGKTAVAKSVASYAKQHGILAANFFFAIPSRGMGQGCSDGKLLFPTVAHQLASFHPSLKASIAAALREDIELPRRSIDIQFDRLFRQPLLFYLQQSLIDQDPDTPIVIVMDGLDECADHELMADILRKLVELAPQLHPPVKLFLTSRPEYYISDILRDQPPEQCIYEYDFQDEERVQSSEDLDVYFRDTLYDIAHKKQWTTAGPWPSAKDLAQLVNRADGLFIYAATVVRFVENSWKGPTDTMRLLLDDTDKVAKAKLLAPIDQLYRAILENAVPPDEQDPEAFIGHIQRILIFVASSRPLDSLNSLSPKELLTWALQVSPASVNAFIRPLHSVLDISRSTEGDLTGNIGTYHRSFNEFIEDEKRCDRKFAATSHAVESFSNHLFHLLDEALDLDEQRYFSSTWCAHQVLEYYVDPTFSHEFREGCMRQWPVGLSSIVTHVFETQLPRKLAMAQDMIELQKLLPYIYMLHWSWKEPSKAEHNKSEKVHYAPRPLLCCLNYFAEMQINPDMKGPMIAIVLEYYFLRVNSCLGKRNHAVTPSSQLATICDGTGFPFIARFFRDPENAERFDALSTDTMNALFGSCAQCQAEDRETDKGKKEEEEAEEEQGKKKEKGGGGRMALQLHATPTRPELVKLNIK